MLKEHANVARSSGAANELAARPAKVDGEADYPARVAAAKRRWGNTRKGESPFAHAAGDRTRFATARGRDSGFW